jgi:hypothetical protein
MTYEQILYSYPTLEKEDIFAVLAYAALLSKEEFSSISPLPDEVFIKSTHSLNKDIIRSTTVDENSNG